MSQKIFFEPDLNLKNSPERTKKSPDGHEKGKKNKGFLMGSN